MAKRRPGRLLPIEFEILECGLDLQVRDGSFYGFALARELAGSNGGTLTAHGTLYKALSRMKDAGLLHASWENSDAADIENRPRRRLYEVTAEGRAAHAAETAQLEEERRAARRGIRSPGLARVFAGGVLS